MPVFTATALCDLTERIVTGLRMPPDEARLTAEVLVESNLAGHDSHGVIRIPQYAQYIQGGQIKPGAPFEIVRETAATAVVNGHGNLGHILTLRALELALKKAERTAVATVLIRECNHIGRLGAYVLRAARRGFVGQIAINSPAGRCVAPWGGIDRKMGTNPLALGAPTRGEPLVLDMTTSVAAEGKVRVLHHKKQPAPADWLIDHAGNPTTRTADFYDQPQGALLPLGGSVGYKGFGLSLMLDVLCGSLSGQGALRLDLSPGHNGVWITLWKVDAFLRMEEYLADVDRLIAWVKSSRRKPGVEEILLPGEIEARTTQQRLRDGISIPDETWAQIGAVAASVGVVVK
jgi:uncharacterized oxidoreductase